MDGAGTTGKRRRGWLVGLVLGLLGAPAGWVISDRMEADNDFCTSCHLSEGVPLHVGIREDFDAPEAVTLVGFHARSGVAGGTEAAREFRCIDCHGGTSLVGRARVKALAAKDAFWYVVGHFEEPTSMRWPLWDEDCAKCHDRFSESDTVEEWAPPRFHQLSVHNADLGVGCVECHLGHEANGDPGAYFIQADHTRAQCARCHAEFE